MERSGRKKQVQPAAPPVLARTGSDSGTMVAIGLGAVAVGGGLVQSAVSLGAAARRGGWAPVTM